VFGREVVGSTRRGGCGFVLAIPGSCLRPTDTRHVCLSRYRQQKGWGWVSCKSPNLRHREGLSL